MHPIVIIGGGPVGLASSILLSIRRIPHLLYERYPGTSIHPKACGINQRTVEILRQMGLEPEVLKHRAPPNTCCKTVWYTSLGPKGQEIISRDAWGGGAYAAEYERASPSPYVMLPQLRLEPLLSQKAKELNPDGVKYNMEVTNLTEKDDHVELKVRRRGSTDGDETVKAAYVIAADGGRMVADKLGIQMNGTKDFVDMVTAHVRSPISVQHPSPQSFITWLINPEMGGSIGTGYMYHLGPYPTTPQTEEWMFACAIGPDDPTNFDEAAMVSRIRKSLAIPDLQVELLSLSHWVVNAISAEQYRSKNGRTFLVGDAAHRLPPWGALGVNTGIQDANNIVWKLELLLRDSRYNKLLDTYDEERRPIGARVAASSLHNMISHSMGMDKALGITAGTSTAENKENVKAYFDETHPEHTERRAAVYQAQKLLDTEFKAPGAEIGWFYPSADLNNEGKDNNHDGQLMPTGELNTKFYCPSTIPGHHLPHAWLRKGDGRVSTRDLLELCKFVLVTEAPEHWGAVEGELVHVVAINETSGYTDIDGVWPTLSGVGKTGAILVRPDGIVAWRVKEFDQKLLYNFPKVLARVLKLPTLSSLL